MVVFSIGLALCVVWVAALVDVARRGFASSGTKVAWFLIVLFFHALGAALYFFLGRKQAVS